VQKLPFDLDDTTVQRAKQLIRESQKKMKATELAKIVNCEPYEATHLIKTTPLMDLYDDESALTLQSIMHTVPDEVTTGISEATTFAS
jgi:hypothetical protein